MSVNQLDSLRRVPIFSSLDDRALEQIAAVATEFEAQAGQILIEIGQPGSGLFVIEEGTVRVELPGGDRIERGPGQFFGELSVLSDTPRTARVAAATDLRGLAIRRGDMNSLLDRQPAIAVAMLHEMAQRLANAI